jgi:NAD-dependent DNA ligase/DNA polymerase/3'-5' exonuclease PolX
MQASTRNKLGKIEKNKLVKEGPCIFPYKYKRQTYTTCADTDKGKICATSINPKTRTLKTYGYCHEYGEKKQSSNKTVKKKPKKKLVLVEKLKYNSPKDKAKDKMVTKQSDLEVSPKPKQMKMAVRLNEAFISILSELEGIMMGQGEPFRAKAYREAAEAIMMYPDDITEPNQLKNVKRIGKTILSKLNEYVETGTLKILERERNNPINVLTKVYGIGPKKAKDLIKQGINTIDDIRKHPELLTGNMRTGVKYYDDIEARIPRKEIDEYNKILTPVFNASAPSNSYFEIVGSYRRGAKNSGDIDIIITNKDDDKGALNTFLDTLIRDKIVIEVLTRGKTKSMVISQIPGERPRRMDLLYASPDEYAFAILYFTGSKVFNTVQRQRALNMGYSLNEHGLYRMVSGKKGERLENKFPTEKSIFDFLNMKYLEPNERVDGHSIATQKNEPVVNIKIEEMKVKEPEKKVVKKKKKKQLTLKKKEEPPKKLIEDFKTNGISALKVLTEDELSTMIRDANNAYYCNNNSILTDNLYDILREYTAEKYPDNEAVKEGHTKCDLNIEKNKEALPYEMWSMDKIKPDTDALKKWKEKYAGPYVLSCKLDGVSGLYSTEGEKPKLYTRGNGKVGQDISHLIPYLKLPSEKNIVIRGEFIIEKELFIKKYGEKFSNPRNFVAGVINQKKITKEKFNDIAFVAYEVIKPENQSPSQQMQYLTSLDVVVVMNNTVSSVDLTNELLSELLVSWRNDYLYEIDGVICANDAIYPRETGNPDHAFAFKMVLGDQIAESKVLDVIWTPSKDGYLKPRVQIEPVVLGGAKIEYATGFNAKFIEDNKIGAGALITLVRSGDVIPHIISVAQPAEQPQMPSVPYQWNATRVDIMLLNKEENSVVREKNIAGFFKVIGVEGLSSGNAKRIINAGYDTLPKIIMMTKEDFLSIEGFKDKLATKIKEGIRNKIEKATMAELMHATNIFGRGFGTRRFQAILNSVPDILTKEEGEEEKIQRAKSVSGMAKKTAEQFVNKIPEFLDWLKEAGLEGKLIEKTKTPPMNTEHPLYGKKFVMTGFRDKELVEKLLALGAVQGSSVSKNTFVVLVKDIEDDTGKADDARKLNIPLMTPEQFKEKFNLI